MKVVIAIDPGVSGGVAVSAFGKTVCHLMPGTEGDRLELIRDLKRTADGRVRVVQNRTPFMSRCKSCCRFRRILSASTACRKRSSRRRAKWRASC